MRTVAVATMMAIGRVMVICTYLLTHQALSDGISALTALDCALNADVHVANVVCLLHENLRNWPQQKTTERVSARSRCNLCVLDFSCMKGYQA